MDRSVPGRERKGRRRPRRREGRSEGAVMKQGILRGSGRSVPHAMPRGGIRSKQTYGQRLATLIRVSARVLIS
ncbi:hypothetical protein CgunFtcFv8_020772 [Champsocephalus gunnari]|uniref:Uncharacterized protein n=1 Tax=Champsocephalus gunnari TaxID=52237 RepID=A0AAN8I0R6_CHAGU|nr:hypothetical protein CgunFtcFv8_020772 [Champsocephalus gunnari]